MMSNLLYPAHRAAYDNMLARCKNRQHPGFKAYGGRGIKVCARWSQPNTGFLNFIADMGERPAGTSLDRIDNDGNYEPGNCRWATPTEQRRNQRPRAARRLRSTTKKEAR